LTLRSSLFSLPLCEENARFFLSRFSLLVTDTMYGRKLIVTWSFSPPACRRRKERPPLSTSRQTRSATLREAGGFSSTEKEIPPPYRMRLRSPPSPRSLPFFSPSHDIRWRKGSLINFAPGLPFFPSFSSHTGLREKRTGGKRYRSALSSSFPLTFVLP